ncbi:MAG: SDR family oxidoreductase [Sphingomonadales bacterium]
MAASRDPHLFCFGLGYVAKALVRELGDRDWTVSGTSRSAETVGSLRDGNIAAFFFDGQAPMTDAGRRLGETTHMLVSAPPGERGDPVLNCHERDIAALEHLRWVGYLSTTGPYGDRGGAWVDERTPPAPSTERGRRRWGAERRWLGLWRDRGVPVHIFRLAGIYGPGRSQIDGLRNGTARRICKEGQVFSRIHIEDLTAVLRASIARPDPGAIYNVCDDEPAPPQNVVAHAAALLGVTPPPLIDFETARMSDMARGFYAENKRVRNARIKAELGVRLKYPTYREGLAALICITSSRPMFSSPAG